MREFQLDNNLQDRIFFTNISELKERLDPYFYKSDFKQIETDLLAQSCTNSLKSLKTYIKKGVFDMSPNKYCNSGIPFLRVADITYEGMDFSSTVFIDNKTHSDEIKTEFLPGDIVIAKIGNTIGKVSVLPNTYNKYNISQNVVGIKISTKQKKKIIPEYLQIFLISKLGQMQIIRYSSNGGKPKITLDALKSIILPIFEIEKQQRIINIYNQGLSIKHQKEDEAKKLLASIDNYLLNELGIILPEKDNSLKSRIFTTSLSKVSGGRFDPDYYKIYYEDLNKSVLNSQYSISKIKDVITFIESGSRPKGGVGNISSGVFSIGGEHVNEKCEVGNGKAKYIPLEFHKKYLLTETKLNDIILVKDGATTGKIGIIEDIAFQKQNINEHVFLIRPEIQKISALYLLYYLHTAVGQDLLKREITGATVTGLTKYSVKNIPIPLPKKEKQAEIANHISEIRAKAKLLEQQAKEILEKAKQEVEQIILGAK